MVIDLTEEDVSLSALCLRYNLLCSALYYFDGFIPLLDDFICFAFQCAYLCHSWL